VEGSEGERWAALRELEERLELPMVILGFVWLGLLVLEFTTGVTALLETLGLVIWAIFILDFALRFALAPEKLAYLRRSWLTAVALLIPALRVFRVFQAVRLLRAARAARGVRLVRVVTSLNRGMKALGATMHRRGFGYVVALSILVVFAGAAGMYSFEREVGGRGFSSYGETLWWTAMLLTSLGSDAWPQTAEGRILCLVLALYGFAVFGYITATLASFFIGRDAADAEGELSSSEDIRALRGEVAALRAELAQERGLG
jgi:voltage-gated potassium channel